MIPVMVVPILTAPELLDQMLDSVDYPVETLVVIDNGHCLPGDFAHREWARAAYLLRMPSNLGVATSWNLGIKATPFAPWWLIANFDVTWPAGSLAKFDTEDASRVLRLSAAAPPWSAFSIGEEVVKTVGLFDEALHPGYFEDTDYQRRCEAAGAPVLQSAIPVDHRNSSTLSAGYREANDRTFGANLRYYRAKEFRGDLTEGGWSLKRRREQSWD
jgi:GT2 family glycosyltransferase